MSLGMDDLLNNIKKAKEMKVEVVSWKCKFVVSKDLPTENFIISSCNQFGRFAKLS